MKDNFIKDYWELLESTSSIPTKVNKVLILAFNEIEQNILEEEPFEKDNNQEEYIHLTIDLKSLEERLQSLKNERELSNNENNKYFKYFGKFNLDDENEKN